MYALPHLAVAAALLLAISWFCIILAYRRARPGAIFSEINCRNCGAIFVGLDVQTTAYHIQGAPIEVPCCAFCMIVTPDNEEADALRAQGGQA